MEATISYTPHAGQQRLHASRARFRIANCGRRFGKTLSFTADILDAAGHVAGDYGWIAPAYQVTERGVDAMRLIAPPEVATIRGSGPRYADVLNGKSRIFYLSADNADPIRGYGFTGVVIDDAPYISKATWDLVIAPTLTDKIGWAALVGTPKGRNWFFDKHSSAGTKGHEDWEAFTFPTSENPYITRKELARLQSNLPANVWRQEYMAEFLEDSAGVFTGIEDCLTDNGCHCDGPFVHGLDLAKHQDFTVQIVVCTQCRRGRAIERYNKLDWPTQKGKIRLLAEAFPGVIQVDATGVGDPIYDDLLAYGLAIAPVRFTAPVKKGLIEGLMISIEQCRIRWPAAWGVVTDELKRYEYAMSPNGHITYNAPEGYHDDCVIALALANHGLGQSIMPHISGISEHPQVVARADAAIADLYESMTAEEKMEAQRVMQEAGV